MGSVSRMLDGLFPKRNMYGVLSGRLRRRTEWGGGFLFIYIYIYINIENTGISHLCQRVVNYPDTAHSRGIYI